MSHKANLASCFLACAFEMATKGGDERWRRAILKAVVGHSPHGFPVRSPDPPLRLRFHLPPSRKRWDGKSVTGHGPTCGMRMLNFLFLQASQRRLKAARRPKSGVYRHPPSESAAPQGTGAGSPSRPILFISFISLISFIYLLYRLYLIYLLYRSLISLYILYLLYRLS